MTIDELLKMISENLGNKAGRKVSLGASEVITMSIFGKLLGYTKLKGIIGIGKIIVSSIFLSSKL